MVVLWVDQIQVEAFHRWLRRLRRLLVLLRQAKVKASTSQRVTRKKLKTWWNPHQQFVKPLLNFKIFLKPFWIQIYISKISFVSLCVSGGLEQRSKINLGICNWFGLNRFRFNNRVFKSTRNIGMIWFGIRNTSNLPTPESHYAQLLLIPNLDMSKLRYARTSLRPTNLITPKSCCSQTSLRPNLATPKPHYAQLTLRHTNNFLSFNAST